MSEARSAWLTPRFDLGLRALVPEWRSATAPATARTDAVAGLNATGLSLALALVIATQAGLPSTSALISVVIGSAIVAVFGGSVFELSGPGIATGSLVLHIAHEYGPTGMGLAVLLCGGAQLAAGALGFGRLAKMMPLPVVHGFTLGIGGVLVLLCTSDLLGVRAAPDLTATHVIDFVSTEIRQARPAAIAIAALTAVATLIGMRLKARVPTSLVAILLAALAAKLLHSSVATLPDLPLALPPLPHLTVPADGITNFAIATLTLFAVATLETLLSAGSESQRSPGTPYDPDQALIGHGLANVLLGFCGGLPVTDAIIRAEALRDFGGKARSAGSFHAVFAAALFPVVLLSDRFVPLAALAGVVVAHTLSLFDPRPLMAAWRVSRPQALVLVVTAVVIVVSDLLTGIETGCFLCVALAMVQVARFRATLHRGAGDAPHQVTFSGPLTFLAVPELERLRARLRDMDLERGVILDMRDVLVMDLTGCDQFLSLLSEAIDRQGKLAIMGCGPASRDMLLKSDRRDLVAPRLAVGDLDVDRVLGRKRAFEMRAQVVASLQKFRSEVREHYTPLFEQLADGQHPHTLFVTCVDSRISPTMLTGSHPGEVFIVRCLGAMVPPPTDDGTPGEAAAIEYAVGVLGVRNIVVCGHSQCGAVKAVKSGQVPDELASLKRWLAAAPAAAGDLSAFDDFDAAARAVTVRQVQNIRQYRLVRERLEKNDLRISAWFYDVSQAELFEWDDAAQSFVVLGKDDAAE